MRWSSGERAFAVEAYFSNRLSMIATQRAFRNRFNVAPIGPVPDRKSIVTWINAFRQTGSTTRRRTGIPRLIRSPENIEAELCRQSFNLAIPTTFCAQTCFCPWSSRSFKETSISRWPALPSLQDGDCAGTLRTWFHFTKERTWGVSRKRSWRRDCLLQSWSTFSYDWMPQQTKHVLLGWHQYPRIASKAFAFT